jgi:hypothetical protein
MGAQAWVIVKDVVLFTVGIGGIIYQLVTGTVDVALLAVFTAMTGVPGLTNLLSLLRPGPATGSPSSSSAPGPSGSDSSSHSPN